MSHFEECLAVNGLAEMLETEFGKWGHCSQQSADITLEVAALENISPELLFYTWAKESCFVLNPKPNTNNRPECIYFWDIGPMQVSMGWGFKSAWVAEYSVKDLHYDQVFGSVFYESGQPCAFTGNPLANLRMGARRLLARKGSDEEKATLYCGPNSQPNRREGWKKYGEIMKDFFQRYTEGK